ADNNTISNESSIIDILEELSSKPKKEIFKKNDKSIVPDLVDPETCVLALVSPKTGKIRKKLSVAVKDLAFRPMNKESLITHYLGLDTSIEKHSQDHELFSPTKIKFMTEGDEPAYDLKNKYSVWGEAQRKTAAKTTDTPKVF